MKKFWAVVLSSAIALTFTAPLFSGCGGGEVEFILSEEGGKHYIVKCTGLTGNLSGEYEIPAYFGEGEAYAPVTEIAEQGFASTAFSKVTVPETVTKIGTAAFSFNSSLETVVFADGIKLSNFPHGMFGNCTGLESITFPDSVTSTEGLIFSGCTKLDNVRLNEGLLVIGARAFENCTALGQIVFPQSINRIGSWAFYNTGLKSVEIPPNLKDTEEGKGLGYASFNSCTQLETVKISSGVKTISSGAFGYCRKLKEVYIPLSVTAIEGAYYKDGEFYYGHAFHNDDSLTHVYFEGSEEEWKEIKIEYKTAFANNLTLDNNAIRNAAKHYGYKN